VSSHVVGSARLKSLGDTEPAGEWTKRDAEDLRLSPILATDDGEMSIEWKQSELSQLTIDGWTAWTSPRLRPLGLNELAMPAQKRLRRQNNLWGVKTRLPAANWAISCFGSNLRTPQGAVPDRAPSDDSPTL